MDSTQLDGALPHEALGDEAALIVSKVPEAVVLKNPNRIVAARRAVTLHQADLLILDDGFQYIQLHRDEDIVLVDATNPFGSGHLIPRGILREPVSALRRATQIVVTRADLCARIDDVVREIRRVAPGAPLRITRHRALGLRNLATGERHATDWLDGTDVIVACGIGNPEAFVSVLENLGAKVRQSLFVPDHQSLPPHLGDTGVPVIVTEKDAAREPNALGSNIFALEIALEDWTP